MNKCRKANTNHKSCRVADPAWKEAEENNRAIEGSEK